MQSLSRLTLVLCCAWILTLLYGEMVAYWIPLWACSWPKPGPDFSSSSSSIDGRAVKIVVVADPQLMDRTSLNLAPKSLALKAAKFYTDLYMRRSFHLSILPFKPNLVIFLGDNFDGGPLLTDQEWMESYSRLKHIFGLEEHGRYADILVYYLCGNHDIGYSSFYSQHPKVINRYEKNFGARNYYFSAGKVNFIAVDAQTLDGPKQEKETFMSWQFLENISLANRSRPRVLLTHIPLYRPNDSPCGSYRSSNIINQRVSYVGHGQGIKYQNYLTKESSDRLLHLIKPELVLSGHDHDQCTVAHSTDFGSVVEHTVGTVSWQQGNLYPSFMLLSAARSPSNETTTNSTVSTSLCFLPMQTQIYIWYSCQFAATILLLLLWPTNGFACFDRFTGIFTSVKSKWTKLKEKTDEEEGEYDMIWDSEGSMHLIKRGKPAPVLHSDASLMAGRGNAMLRPSANKQEASSLIEMNADVSVEKAGKTRQNRSFMTISVLRLIRVSRLVAIVAAVNFPLYMMLLFKDWIDH